MSTETTRAEKFFLTDGIPSDQYSQFLTDAAAIPKNGINGRKPRSHKETLDLSATTTDAVLALRDLHIKTALQRANTWKR
ncbi:MAG: hypothetical protein GY804_10415 [Alphaproteobacteria bacterium]|nr:hypothetical protein [Alphaproteobacteria bacterium]